MKKFPFTSRGVADLQAVLYRLDEPGLCNEAGLIAEDIPLWAKPFLNSCHSNAQPICASAELINSPVINCMTTARKQRVPV